MSKIKVCLIEKNALLREGIKSLLNQSSYEVIAALPGAEDVQELDITQETGLFILGICGSRENLKKDLRTLFADAPKSKIVVLSESLNRDAIACSFSEGAHGFLMKDIAAKSFIASLDLLITGEKVFPTCMAKMIVGAWNMGSQKHIRDEVVKALDLSDREIDIIQCLTKGESNKLIARDLEIAESTVKVHVKSILRKIGFTNRTQVAIWAINNGFHDSQGIVNDRPSTIIMRKPYTDEHFVSA